MSFIRNTITLSIVAAFAINSPQLLASDEQPDSNSASLHEELSDESYEESYDYGEEPDESLEDFYGDEDFVSIATGNKQLISKAP